MAAGPNFVMSNRGQDPSAGPTATIDAPIPIGLKAGSTSPSVTEGSVIAQDLTIERRDGYRFAIDGKGNMTRSNILVQQNDVAVFRGANDNAPIMKCGPSAAVDARQHSQLKLMFHGNLEHLWPRT